MNWRAKPRSGSTSCRSKNSQSCAASLWEALVPTVHRFGYLKAQRVPRDGHRHCPRVQFSVTPRAVSRWAPAAGDCQYTARSPSSTLLGFQPCTRFFCKQNGLQLANYQAIVLPSLEEKAGNHRGTEAQSEMLWFPLVPSVPLCLCASVPLWLILFRR